MYTLAEWPTIAKIYNYIAHPKFYVNSLDIHKHARTHNIYITIQYKISLIFIRNFY